MNHVLHAQPHQRACPVLHCTTVIEVHCTCGWAQGCETDEEAMQLAAGHAARPNQSPVQLPPKKRAPVRRYFMVEVGKHGRGSITSVVTAFSTGDDDIRPRLLIDSWAQNTGMEYITRQIGKAIADDLAARPPRDRRGRS